MQEGDEMRDHIFRLIKDSEIVGYELHKKGLIIHSYDVEFFDNYSFEIFRDVIGFYIKHDSKDEFTGLLDSKGNRIFEGDVVLYSMTGCAGTIAYDTLDARFTVAGGMTYGKISNRCSITGNIHDKDKS
jgi:hypothetical protein